MNSRTQGTIIRNVFLNSSISYYIRTFFILFLVVGIGTVPAKNRRPGFDAQEIGRILLLENGRKKPLDTYARNKLLQFSGKRHVGKQSALSWITDLLLDPSRVDFSKVFLINNPDFAATLGVPPEHHRRYSYASLSTAAEKIQHYYDQAEKTTAANRNEFDREIMRIYANLIEYRTLASTMQFATPDIGFYLPNIDSTVDVPEALSNPDHPPSFFDMLRYNEFLSTNMTRIQQKGTDSTSETDSYIIAITHKMYEFNSMTGNPPPEIIPSVSKDGEIWYSPAGFACAFKRAATTSPLETSFIALALSYRTKNQNGFDAALKKFLASQKDAAAPLRLPDPSLELAYNRLNAFFIAKILLGLAAILSLITLVSGHRAVHIAALAGIVSALVLSTAGIIMRMFIMHHPPVTNLYETFIFVGWSMMVIGIFIERIGIRSIGLITASLAGFIFFHVAGRYAADGDTLGMLAAVLDSGFWLTTHIITIALGYAGCMGAGFVGHIYLVQRLVAPGRKDQSAAIAKAVYGVFAFGLLFTTLGTVTGGMWADQAWGRFWGWDPKENGALLIILWCTIVFHARLTKRIADAGTAAGAIISSILVMCTWIGVNLLGTGLHSYGFTSSGARMLAGYSGFELLFLIAVGIGLKVRNK